MFLSIAARNSRFCKCSLFSCDRNKAVKAESSKYHSREYVVVSCSACFNVAKHRSYFGSRAWRRDRDAFSIGCMSVSEKERLQLKYSTRRVQLDAEVTGAESELRNMFAHGGNDCGMVSVIARGLCIMRACQRRLELKRAAAQRSNGGLRDPHKRRPA